MSLKHHSRNFGSIAHVDFPSDALLEAAINLRAALSEYFQSKPCENSEGKSLEDKANCSCAEGGSEPADEKDSS